MYYANVLCMYQKFRILIIKQYKIIISDILNGREKK